MDTSLLKTEGQDHEYPNTYSEKKQLKIMLVHLPLKFSNNRISIESYFPRKSYFTVKKTKNLLMT